MRNSTTLIRIERRTLYKVSRYITWPLWMMALLAGTRAIQAQQLEIPQHQPSMDHRSPRIEEKVSALLAQMTLQEKIGQLVQYSGGNATGPSPNHVKYAEMAEQGQLGSLLNVVGAEETNRYQQLAVERSRLHIPLLFGYDVIHGYRTSFPIPLALASSFSPELIQTVAQTASDEAAQDGIRWLFSPMVDIARDSRWGRIAESAGEDPFLGSALARAWVLGIQHRRDDGTMTAACIKHFAAYGAVIAGRDYNAVDMSPHLLNEVYLPPYRAGIDAGALTVMSAFNSLNGIPMTADRSMLTDLLRKQWDFQGFVVSDWGAVHELLTHSVVMDADAAAARALTAGVDMDMEGNLYSTRLASLVQSGQVPLSVIDEAARRVLRVKFEMGLFEHPYTSHSLAYEATPAKRQLARDAAAQTLILLKNDMHTDKSVLPLNFSEGSVALIGPLADSQTEMLGSWSLPANPHDAVTLRTALTERLGDRLHYAQGTNILTTSTAGFAEAEQAAKASDIVILALGESGPDMTGESTSRAHLGIPGNQEQLLEDIVALGKPVILVLFSGRPLAIPWAAQHATAILEAWFPGMEAGHAIADVLSGDRSPVGHLPVSMPYAVGQEPLYYAQPPTGRPATKDLTGPISAGVSRFNSRYIDEATVPLYPFGWGLTYTTFSYQTPKLTRKELSLTEVVKLMGAQKASAELLGVDVAITNAGKRPGTTVAQLYLRSEGTTVEQPLRQLHGFMRVSLQPGETRTIHFALTAQDLAFYNEQMQNVLEPSRYLIYVGDDSTTTNMTPFTLTR